MDVPLPLLRPVIALGILGAAMSASAQATAPDASKALAYKIEGLRHGYSLDYPEALASFEQAMRADPSDPAAPRFAAITFWMRLLFRLGAVTVDDYLGQVRSSVDRREPDPQLAAQFQRHLDLAFALAERRLRSAPDDADAHFQLGSAAALRASYMATIEGRVAGSFGTGRRAYSEHRRALELDPSRKDAGLIVGAYHYTVAGLPLHIRLLARIAGLGSGREKGLRFVEGAAAHPGLVQSNALFTLILLYNREARYDDALRTVKALQGRYPRNRLLWLEEAATALRAGRPAQALQAAEEGLTRLRTDSRVKAFGEEARWRYQAAAARIALGQAGPALTELDAALASEAPGWVHGRVRIERGKTFDLAGRRVDAVGEYRRARDLCRAENDDTCEDEAKRLLSRPYAARRAESPK